MLYEFAIIPDVFDGNAFKVNPALEGCVLELLAGISENGIIADLHKGYWKPHVEQLAAALPHSIREHVIRRLGILHQRRRLVLHPRRPGGDPARHEDWLDLALDSHGRRALDGIILTDDLSARCGRSSSGPLIELSKVPISATWRACNSGRSILVERTPAAFEESLTPLLRYAKTLDLVDPYLSPHVPRFMNTVRLCLNLLGKRGHGLQPGRMRIHAGDPTTCGYSGCRHRHESVVSRLDAWQRQLTRLVGPQPARLPHSIEVCLWRKKDDGQELHDRFILTDQCGVAVLFGLDCDSSKTASRTVWTMLDWEVKEILRSKFYYRPKPGEKPQEEVFQLLDYRTLP